MTRKLIEITALLLLASVQFSVAQPNDGERGIPFPSEHYAPPEYQQSPQNWDLIQDDRGFMYVANNDGVLQYDGERWRLIPTNTGTFVRSLAADSLVRVGAKGDFGYLSPDSLGVLRYVSLYERVPEDKRDFEDVWGTHTTTEGVYYQSNSYLFRWDGASMEVWSSEDSFHTSFTVGGRLYVRETGRGLLRMEGDSLALVPGGDAFHETPVYMMAQHPSGDILVATQNKGLQLYDGETFRSLASEITRYLQENDLYHGTRLPGNRYALATLGGGVVIIDEEGRVVRVLNESSGLPDPVVNHVYSGREGQIWMALNSGGVFRADLNAPLTIHDARTGLEGGVHGGGIYRPDDTMYVSTGRGLYALKEQKDQVLGERSAHFEKWVDSRVWDMLSVGGDLLAARETDGVRLLSREGSGRGIGEWAFTYDLLNLTEKQVVYAGTRTGLKGLVRTPGGWDSFSIEGIQGEIRSLTAEDDGTLWAATSGGNFIRIVLSDDGREAETMTRYSSQDGLPEGYNGITIINGNVTAVSGHGLFQVDNADQNPESWRFSRRASLLPSVEEAGTARINSLQKADDSLFVVLGDRVFVGELRKDGSYSWEEVDALRFSKSSETRLFVDEDDTVWLGDGNRLFRYAPGELQGIERPSADFSAQVRQVTTLRRGRVVYGGNVSGLGEDSSLALPYGRDLRVDVAAPLFGTAEPHQYRYKLVGRNDRWGDWTSDASRRYRNLWEGTYRFRVQAQNDRGTVSNVGALTLRILPPWYRTVWAYLVYGIAFVAMAYGYRRYYQIKEQERRARERVQELERERIVAERIKQANERLREANRLKEDFLANTSHELRTPLTNILGSLEVLRDTASEEQQQFLDMIEKNGKRLKRTLNALLDLSMLRSGDEELDRAPFAIDECARKVASELRTDAEEKGLSFRVDTPEEPVYADVDDQYLKQILRNLIENAIKYTEEGCVAVSAGQMDGRVYVEVEDTGIGIDDDFLPDLFDEFKQESRGRDRTYEGNGLGLSLSARLAGQMDGTISVETEKGEGSVFTVEFPRSSTPSPESDRS